MSIPRLLPIQFSCISRTFAGQLSRPPSASSNSSEKSLLATVLLAGALIVLLVAQQRRSPALRRIGLVVLCVTLLAGCSVGRDLLNHEFTQHGVVVTDGCTARKGAAETFESAFNRTLPSGTEFVVLAEQNDWLQIQIPSAGTGWIARRNAVTY